MCLLLRAIAPVPLAAQARLDSVPVSLAGAAISATYPLPVSLPVLASLGFQVPTADWKDIIETAGQSALGILALLCLLLAVLTPFLLKGAPWVARLVVFLVLFVAVVALGRAAVRRAQEAASQPVAHGPPPPDTIAPHFSVGAMHGADISVSHCRELAGHALDSAAVQRTPQVSTAAVFGKRGNIRVLVACAEGSAFVVTAGPDSVALQALQRQVMIKLVALVRF
jgi:hypothetical protein